MAVEHFANNAATTLNGSIDSSQTSITVTAYSSFPSIAQFRIRIDDEIMLVTAGAGTTSWTVSRAQEGTTGASHADAAAVGHILTAGALSKFRDDSIVRDEIANLPSPGLPGRIFLPTDGLVGFRDDGSAWSTFGPIYQFVKPPIVSAWAASVNIDVAVDGPGCVNVRETNSQSGDNLRGLFNSVPGSTPYHVDAAMVLPTYTGGGYTKAGIAFRESGTSKIILLYAGLGLAGLNINIDKYNSATSYAGNYVTLGNVAHATIVWFRLEHDGTNLNFYASQDGQFWQLVASHTPSDFFSSGPDQIGICMGVFGGDTGKVLQAKYVSWNVG